MNNTNIPESQIWAQTSISAEVVFGSPGRGCAGSGVCRLIPFQKLENWNGICAKYEATINWYQHGSLDIVIRLSNISHEDRLKWFSDPCFLIEEDFMFPLWLQHQLKQKSMYIPSGKYPYIIRKDELKLFLPWSKLINLANRNFLRTNPLVQHA